MYVFSIVDTVDAAILLKTMHNHLGISIHTSRTVSSVSRSVLGSLLFTVYTVAVQGIIMRLAVDYHMSADDLHIYTSYCPHMPGDL